MEDILGVEKKVYPAEGTIDLSCYCRIDNRICTHGHTCPISLYGHFLQSVLSCPTGLVYKDHLAKQVNKPKEMLFQMV